MRWYGWLGVVVAAACGCASSPEIRRAADGVQVIDGAAPPGFQVLGEVQGLSCRRNLEAGSPNMDDAREQLRIEAARLGANAVASVFCQEQKTSLGENCWRAIRCVGDAGRAP